MFRTPSRSTYGICHIQRYSDNVQLGKIINRKHVNAAHTKHCTHTHGILESMEHGHETLTLRLTRSCYPGLCRYCCGDYEIVTADGYD